MLSVLEQHIKSVVHVRYFSNFNTFWLASNSYLILSLSWSRLKCTLSNWVLCGIQFAILSHHIYYTKSPMTMIIYEASAVWNQMSIYKKTDLIDIFSVARGKIWRHIFSGSSQTSITVSASSRSQRNWRTVCRRSTPAMCRRLMGWVVRVVS